ncbi:MAG: ABC transporter substrate-binding protein, partial [Fibrobacter sp.]|nr:ABC transporter substrate-binding protein [Fibrobacter sp.]
GAEGHADSIYKQSKMQFEAQINGGAAGEAPNCPRVLAGMAYGGIWYAPGGKSYTANLIRQAGGCYLWASDTTRELKFSLEEVFAVADSADVWVNPGIYGTPEDILAAEPRLSRIRAFKQKRVCQNDARKSAGGGNDFYEGAVARPVELVENLRDCLFTGISGNSGPKLDPSPYRWYRNIYNF